MIPLQIVRIDENGQLDINQFASMIDVSRVEYYSIEPESTEYVFKLYFYDKNQRLIKPSPQGKPRKGARKSAVRRKAA